MFLLSKRSAVCGLFALTIIISHAVAFHEIVGMPPSITTEPTDQVIFETNAMLNKVSLILPCTVDGDPLPTVTWYMGDDVIVPSQFVMDNGSLVIPNITEGEYASRDGVDYYCQASSVIGRPQQNYTATVRSRTATVTYAFFDGFTQDVNTTVSVVAGSNVALKCDVRAANPPPMIEWHNDPDPNADPDTSRIVPDDQRIYYLDGGRYLAIITLTADEIARQYRCVVTNARMHQRRLSPTIYTLDSTNFPEDTLVEYKQIGNVVAFVGDERVDFSYVGGSISSPGSMDPVSGIFSQCSVNGQTVFSQHGIGHITMNQIPAPSPGNNEFTIQCRIGSADATTFRSGTLTVHERAVITSSPADERDFVIGQQPNITFICEASGVPAPDIEWFFNGDDNLDSGLGISINGNTLIITQPSVAHSGMYQCFASNGFSTSSSSWILELREPIAPEILPYNFSALGAQDDRDYGAVLVGDQFTIVEFFVEIVADPCPTVQWTFGDDEISTGDVYDISDPCAGGGSPPYTFTLNILNISEATSGMYSAMFTSLQDQVIAPQAYITIPVPPSITSIDLTLQGDMTTLEPCLLDASSVIIRCTVVGFPRPELVFSRGSSPVEAGEATFERYTMPYFDELRIDNIMIVDDDNAFSCRLAADNAVFKNAEYPFCTMPSIADATKTDDPQLGSGFFVQCVIDGTPRVTVEWMKDNDILNPINDDNVEIVVPVTSETATSVISRVNVRKARDTDDGRYTCVGTNAAGSVSRTFQIMSQDPNAGLLLPLNTIIGIAAGAAGLIILIVLAILLCVCVYQCALRSKRGSMDMPPPYSGKMYTDYGGDGRGNVDDSDEEDGQPEAFNPQYESLPALRPNQPPGYKPTPSYPHGAGDDFEMVKVPPPDTDSFVGGGPPYMHQDNGLPSSSYRPTVDDFVSEDAQFV